MRKFSIILIIYSIYFLSPVKAQKLEWITDESRWYYTAPYEGDCLYMEAVKDTTIDNKVCNELEIRFCSSDRLLSTEYFHQQNDSILVYNHHHDKFILLFDFSAKVGDTVVVLDGETLPTDGFYKWKTNLHDSTPIFKYQIVKEDSIKISNVWLRRQEIRQVENTKLAFHRNTIIEKLGPKDYMFGRLKYIHTDNDYFGTLRCYEDKEIYYQSDLWKNPCDYPTGINSPTPKVNIKVIPNPVKGNWIKIYSSKPVKNIYITDLNGTILKIYTEVNDKKITLDKLYLPEGIYIINIHTVSKIINKKIVKL